MKKNVLWLKRIASNLLIILIVFVTCVCVVTPFSSGEEDILSATNSKVWSTNLTDITSVTRSDGQVIWYVPMSDFVDSTFHVKNPQEVLTSKNIRATDTIYIGIATAAELYAFSVVCNDTTYKTSYLQYDYKLMNHIDYVDIASVSNQYFMKPIGWDLENTASDTGISASYFQGSFDGQGFTISNMYYEQITEESTTLDGTVYPTKYPTLSYYSMFSVLGKNGVVKNLGLINPIMLQAEMIGDYMIFASALVGENYGTMDHVYIQDTRDEKKAGLIADGGYNISYLLSVNNGIVKDCYVDATRVAYDNVMYNMVQTVVFNNFGTFENVYYYAASSSTPQNPVEGIEALNNESEFLSNTYFSIENGWYSNATYLRNGMNVENDLRLFLPILQGLDKNSQTNYWKIETAVDYSYFVYLLGHSGAFRSSFFELTKTIDLNAVAPITYQMTSNTFSGTFTSGAFDDTYIVATNDSQAISTNSILNAQIYQGISGSGFRQYGLFPIVTGTISNINVINMMLSMADLGNSCNYSETYDLGFLCGELRNGSISNVQTSGVMNLNLQDSTVVGKINAGGICGYASSGSMIKGSVSKGTMEENIQSNFNSNLTNSAIGGIAGTMSGLKECRNNLSLMTLKARQFTSSRDFIQNIGGICGVLENSEGFTKNSFYGSIAVGEEDTETYVGTVYAGGIIGRHLSGESLISSLYNAGKITYYAYHDSAISLAGVLNVDSLTGTANYDSLSNAQVMEIKNCKNLSPSSNTIFCSNVLTSKYTIVHANGLYNLNKVKNLTTKQQEVLPSQEFDLAIIGEFAPCMNGLNFKKVSTTTTAYVCNITNSYNYQNYSYTTPSQQVSFRFVKISGNLTGNNYNLNRIRNEGNIRIFYTKSTTIAMGTGTDAFGATDYNKLKVYGCFEEVSVNCVAQNCYNGGNIDILNVNTATALNATTADVLVAYNIYASGICYKNANGENYFTANGISVSASSEQDSNIVITDGHAGSLYNCLNAGNIHLYGVKSETDTSLDGDGIFVGCCRVSGIVSVNAGRLSKCYNVGNIYNINHTLATNTSINGHSGGYSSSEFEVESAGITFLALSRYAQIIDSANGGDVVSISTSTITSGTGWVNASGIVGRNEKNESGSDKGSSDSSGFGDNRCELQKIEFTINYGNIFAYNANITKAWSEHRCKAGGLLSLGVANLINVLNYGGVYSNSCAGGIYGLVYMSKFYGSRGNTNYTFVANAVNYGTVEKLTKYPSYSNSNDFTSEIQTTTSTSTTSQSDFGSVIGQILNGSSMTAANTFAYFRVSYLINMASNLNMIGNIANVTSDQSQVVQDMVKYMATVNSSDKTPTPFNQTNYSTTQIKSYTLSSESGGIFSSDFPLRNSTSATSGYITNQYIADYIQFIPANKTNEYLLDKVGFMDIIRAQALTNILASYQTMGKILSENLQTSDLQTIYSTNISTSVYQQVLNNSSMINDLFDNLQQDSSLSSEDITYILDQVLTTSDFTTLLNNQETMEFIIEKAENSNLITTEYRNQVMTTLLNDDTQFQTLMTKYPQQMGELFSQYLTSLQNDASTNNSISTLYTAIKNNSFIITNALNNLSQEDKVSFVKAILPSQSLESLQTIFNLCGGTIVDIVIGNIMNLSDSDTNSTYSALLQNQDVTDALLNQIKSSFELGDAAIQVIAEELRDTVTDSKLSVYNGLVALMSNDTCDLVANLMKEQLNSAVTITDSREYLNDLVNDNNLTINTLYSNLITIINNNTSLINNVSQKTISDNASFDSVVAILNNQGLLQSFFNYAYQNYSSVQDKFTNGTYDIYEEANSTNGGVKLDSSTHSLFVTGTSSESNAIYGGQYYLDGNVYKTISSYASANSYEICDFKYNTRTNSSYYQYKNNVFSSNNYSGYHYSLETTTTSGLCFKKTTSGSWWVTTTYTFQTSAQRGTHVKITYSYDNIKNDTNLITRVLKSMSENDTNIVRDMIEYYRQMYSSIWNQDYYQAIYDNSSDELVNAFSSNNVKNTLTIDEKKSIMSKIIEQLYRNNPDYDFSSIISTNTTVEDYYNAVAITGFSNSSNVNILLGQMNQTNQNKLAFINLIYQSLGSSNSNLNKILFTQMNSDNYLSDDDKNQIAIKYATLTNAGFISLYNQIKSDISKEESITYLLNPLYLTQDKNQNNALYRFISSNAFIQNASSYSLGQIIGMYSYYSNSIFTNAVSNLGYDINDASSLTSLLNDSSIDIADFATNLGIYALASSDGILNGEFMPDNIVLTDIDPVISTDVNGNPTTSNVWRGGESQELSWYDSHSSDNTVTNSVNYKIYHNLKQLRKSIATSVFQMSLESSVNGNTYQITNDAENDIDIKNSSIHYYIPQNADELKASSLTVDRNLSSYELSNKASIKSGTGTIALTESKRNANGLFNVGEEFTGKVTIVAEDTTVTQDYTITVTIVSPCGFDDVNSITMNQNTSSTYTTETINSNALGKVIVSTKASYASGMIHVVYSTRYIPNKKNLTSQVSFTNEAGEELDSNQIVLTSASNNGIVIESGNTSDPFAWASGTVFFEASVSDDLPSGTYRMVIQLNESLIYMVEFQKAVSTNCNFESLAYQGELQQSSGATSVTTNILYGTALTEQYLTTLQDGVPEYLSSFTTAPLSTFIITSASVTSTTVSGVAIKTYQIVYEITAEDQTTKSTFTHYLVEKSPSSSITASYKDDSVISPTISTDAFSKTETPTYRFDYDLSNVNLDDGRLVSVSKNTASQENQSYYGISVFTERGMEIYFYDSTPSTTYQWNLQYLGENDFNATTHLTWSYDFATVTLTKNKSLNSYLNNLTFISETVLTTVDTLIEKYKITPSTYEEEHSKAHTVVCLTNQIYYNEYDVNTNKQNTFYAIGLVSKTNLTNYSPIFTLQEDETVYRITTINGVTYRFLDYSYLGTSSNTEHVVFMATEDMSKVYTYSYDSTSDTYSLGTQVSTNSSAFTYQNVAYTLSSYSGKGNDNDISYAQNFESDVFDSQGNPSYVYATYRIYSEAYIDHTNDTTGTYYTDYNVTVMDATSTIRFELSVMTDSTIGEDELPSIFVYFQNYQGTNKNNVITITDFLNYMSVYAYRENGSVSGTNYSYFVNQFSTNTSGFYTMCPDLPTHYTYSVSVTDRKAPQLTTTYDEAYFESGKYVEIKSTIVTRKVQVQIVISKRNLIEKDWGIHTNQGISK